MPPIRRAALDGVEALFERVVKAAEAAPTFTTGHCWAIVSRRWIIATDASAWPLMRCAYFFCPREHLRCYTSRGSAKTPNDNSAG